MVDSESTHSRRQLLRTAGLLGAAGLAGCPGNSGNSGTTATADGTDNGGEEGTTQTTGSDEDTQTTVDEENLPMVDQDYRISHAQDITADELTLNMSDWQNFPWGIRQLIFSPPAYQRVNEQKWNGILFDDVTVEPGSVSITVKENANWSNGDPITGKHVRNHVLRSIFMRVNTPRNEVSSPSEVGAPMLLIRSPDGSGDWRQNAIEVDGKSVTFKTKEGWFGDQSPWRKSTIAREFWKANPESPAWDYVFDEFMGLSDPFGENFEQTKSLRTAYRSGENAPGPMEFPTNGPFKLVQAEGRKRTLERHEGHPFSEYINWPRVIAEYIESPRSQRTALISGHLDAWSGSMPQRTLESLPDSVEEARYDVPRGASLNMHIGDGVWNDPRVRQALQYIIDREMITQAVSGETVIEANPVAVPGAMGGLHDYFDDSFLNQLHTYGKDNEKATQLLQDAGFSKQGGSWHTPEGEPWSFKFQTSASVPQFETLVVQQLNRFGINAELYTMDNAVYDETIKTGKHDLIKGSWGGELHSALAFLWWIPQNPVQRGIHGIWSDEQVKDWGQEVEHVNIDENGYAHNFQAEDLKDYFTVEAPPIGEPDGNLQEYDAAWAAMMLDWGYQFEDRAYDDVLKELAWVYNWYVPEIPIHKERAQTFHDTSDWRVPPMDNQKQWSRGFKSLINSGAINARPDN